MKARMSVFTLILGAVLLVTALATAATSLAQARPGYGIGVSGLVPGRDYVAGQVIVGLGQWGKEGERPRLAIPHQGRVVGQIHGSALLLEFPTEEAALKAIPALLAHPNVSFVERNHYGRVGPGSGDPAALWHHFPRRAGGGSIGSALRVPRP